MSAEWVRTGNRNAATDSTDIVYYNPAGTTGLPQGFHLNLFTLARIQKREFTISDLSETYGYNQDSTENFFPSVCGVLNIEKWSVFGGIDIPNGETVINYTGGSPTTHLAGRTVLSSPLQNSGYDIMTETLTEALTGAPYNFVTVGDDGSGDKHIYTDIDDGYFEEKGQYHISTLGLAYRFSPSLSVAVGLRHVNADRSRKAGVTISGFSDEADAMNSYAPGFFPEEITFESKQTMVAWGTGGILGIQYRNGDRYNIALRLHSPVKLIERLKVYKDELNLFQESEKQRNDLPGSAGLGIGYAFTEKLHGELDFDYWFQSFADMERYSGSNRGELAGDAWRTGASLSYDFHKRLLLSAGTSYTCYERSNLSLYTSSGPGIAESTATDNIFLGTGFLFRATEKIRLNFGVSHTLSFSEKFTMKSQNSTISTKVENNSTIIAFGIDITVW